uniref:CRAL-TRIO domain-containing protein n=1 Tax=Zooxanthella nutricula TaxID=1333877 RepID=A0A6V0GH43_9DINO
MVMKVFLLGASKSEAATSVEGAAGTRRREPDSPAEKGFGSPRSTAPQPQRPRRPRRQPRWAWASCCGDGRREEGGGQDSEPLRDASAFGTVDQASGGNRVASPKFCGMRMGLEPGGAPPSVEAFPSAPIGEEFPESWASLLDFVNDERALCADLRHVLKDTRGPKDPVTMLRFLRARSGDVQKAAAMYRNARSWHEGNGWEHGFRTGQIDDELHRRFDAYWKPIGLLGRDREGRPVLWDRIGTSETGNDLPIDFLKKHEVYTMTRLQQAMEELSVADGRPHMYFTVVVDLAGLGVKHMNRRSLSEYQQLVRIDEDLYPEMVKRVIVVNAPRIFDTIWSIVKYFFDEGTRAKIQIAGKTRPEVALAPFLESKWIPQALGGDLHVGSGGCDSAYCEPFIIGATPVSDDLRQSIWRAHG